jgi:HK97 family phage portal protein
MNLIKKLLPNYKRQKTQQQATSKSLLAENYTTLNSLSGNDDFTIFDYNSTVNNAYYLHASVNIAVNILIRNIERAEFTVKKDGNDVNSGVVYDLFRRPNVNLSRYDLWKETAAWWFIEGEAFWWFGADYSGGIPKEIYILDPRKIKHEGELNCLDYGFQNITRRWFYYANGEIIPLLSDELIHFREFNPWNSVRGVNPLLALSLEIEQDYYANKSNSQLLKNNAVPQGILKTEQTLRPEEADQLERRWENKYGNTKASRKIAVLGKGTNFQPLSFSPDVIKFFELKRWNLYTILARYGIPPRVAYLSDRSSALSGKDTTEQHSAFWKFTLIPILKQYEQILESQFFMRFGLKEQGVFDLFDVPELQESEDAQRKRDIAEIKEGLKTINDILKERGREPKPWGDVWYKPKNLSSVDEKKSGDD